MELTVESSPLLVAGRSLMTMAKPNVSEDTFHRTPSALSIGVLSKSKSLTWGALSDSGIVSITFLEFESHLVNLKPPSANRSCKSFASLTASSS